MSVNRKTVVLFALGVILVAVSVWQILSAQNGLDVIRLPASNPPVTVIKPAGIPAAGHPTVLIAHGFAGSAVLMRGFALTLAHAGYTTVSWDFEGHGANPNPFLLSSDSTSLLRDAETALNLAGSSGLVDTQHVAILGHSMGSGVALSFGVVHPDTYATIAISPVNQSVNPTLPRNLLLMAGSLEPQFVSNAEELLTQAGGERGNLAGGAARQLVVIPNVEHISILFSPLSHSTVLKWLDGTFGVQPGATSYVDRRIVWFVIGIIGFVCLSMAAINTFPDTQPKPDSITPLWLRLIGVLGGSLVATLALWAVSRMGVDLSQLFGLLVGGYIIIWFGVSGMINLAISRPHIIKPSVRDLLMAFIAFAALWLGVGLLGNFVWLPWLLIPARLWLWIPASLITLPWFLAIGQSARYSGAAGQVGWWLIQVVAVIAGLYLGLRLSPTLGFLVLIFPVIPIMLGLQSLAISPKRSSWAYAISGAMFTGWLLLAVFPLQ